MQKRGQTTFYIFLPLMLYKKVTCPLFSFRVKLQKLMSSDNLQPTKYCVCFNF